MSRPPPAEFDLVAACCRWPPSPARENAVRAAVAAPIDWDQVERVLARHRVAALALDGLRRANIAVPAGADRRLAEAAAAAGLRALAMAREELRLQRAFDEAGLPAMFVKGSSLAVLAYGALGMKQSWDIDLLTTPENAPAGRHLLQRLGYELIEPLGLSDPQFVRFSELSKEAIFINPSLDIAVELHWRLIDNKWLLPGIDTAARVQTVAIGGGAVRTLADDALFAYLCAHGTMHGWSRLKWLADLGAFLAARDGAEIQRLNARAAEMGGGRTAAVALLLCHRLFELALPPALFGELGRDRLTEALAMHALRCMTHGGGAMEFGLYSRPALGTRLSQLVLVPGRRYFWSEIGLKWTSAADHMQVSLPRRLDFLYYVLRLPLLLWRMGKHLLGRTG